MDIHEWPRYVKSARQKRRLVIKDRDKQLIQLDKRRSELWMQRRLLPMVPLDYPYQRGWKRFFVLRDDVKRGPQAEFYTELLAKVNTFEYSNDKTFRRKKRRRRRYGYVVREQLLRELSTYNWDYNRPELTDEQKACFTRVDTYDIKTRRADVKYVITEPWRFVLKVAPHIVTHVKLIDVDIERELSYINDHIESHGLDPRLDRLTYGRRYRWRDDFTESPKYINKLKNIPRYSQTADYLDLET